MRRFRLFFVLISVTFPATASPSNLEVPMGLFPKGEIFSQLIADPYEFRFDLSVGWMESSLNDAVLGHVNMGESFSIYRWRGGDSGASYEIAFAGGIFSQFDLFAGSGGQLLNIDFFGAVPFYVRFNKLSFRFRFYHQSSHLGDEFLVSTTLPRVSLAFESVGALASYDFDRFRIYGGGEYWPRTEPAELGKFLAQAGLEYAHPRPLFRVFDEGGYAHFVSAIDVRMLEERNFDPGISWNGGLEFREKPAREQGRVLRALIDVYYGPMYFGQFFFQDQDLFFAGISLQARI